MTDLAGISVTTIDGEIHPLGDYLGKATLVVNVASRCGFTPQYKGLETLYRKHKDQGLAILAFPCNQFGRQEPGDETEIKAFCSLHYDVSFPLFAKIDVNGINAHPLYRALKARAPGILGSRSIKWNFTKFLLDRHGDAIARYAPFAKPEGLEKRVVELLSA